MTILRSAGNTVNIEVDVVCSKKYRLVSGRLELNFEGACTARSDQAPAIGIAGGATINGPMASTQ
jgi:hypothetical protein